MTTANAIPLRFRLGGALRQVRAALLGPRRRRLAAALPRLFGDHMLRDLGLSRIDVDPGAYDGDVWRR